MAEPIDVFEKLLDLGNGLSIWRVSFNRLREQDRNARSMSDAKFKRLTENIRKDSRMESLPLCVPTSGTEPPMLSIISGHHRTRAAASVGLPAIHVMACNDPLSKSHVIAKQLAHNAIAGTDDPTVLADLYKAIDDTSAKIESALTDQELTGAMRKVPFQEIGYTLDFELLAITFLPHEKENFDRVLKEIEADSNVIVAPLTEFAAFRKAMLAVGRQENIRNVTGMLSRMAELASERLAELNPPKEPAKPPEVPQIEAAKKPTDGTSLETDAIPDEGTVVPDATSR